MSKNYVVNGFGFYCGKELVFDLESFSIPAIPIGYRYKWTNKLREAKEYNSSTAKNIVKALKEQDIIAFVWNPFAEEPIRDKYEVTRRKEFTNYNTFDRDYHKVLEWRVEKLVMENKTDVKFLNDTLPKNYYDYDEAVEICRQKNLEILLDLEKKMNDKNVIKQ